MNKKDCFISTRIHINFDVVYLVVKVFPWLEIFSNQFVLNFSLFQIMIISTCIRKAKNKLPVV